MPTLVLSPRFSKDSQLLWQAATADGEWSVNWSVQRAIRHLVPPELTDPVVYGELIFCDVMAQKLGLGLLDPPDDWLAKLPQKYLRRAVTAMTVGDLSTVRDRCFIKPANDKLFPASIYESGLHVPVHYVEPSCPVLVSEIVEFDTEVRCYILDRKIATAAVYLHADHLPEASLAPAFQGAQQWLQYLLDDPTVEMPSAFVIDVGFLVGKGWAVIEANQAYSSGIYNVRGDDLSADPRKLLPLLERAGGPRSKVSLADQKYIRGR